MKYSKKEVDEFILTAIRASMEGCIEWVKEETDIVETSTSKVLENVELKLKPNAKTLSSHIFKVLSKEGIEISKKVKDNFINPPHPSFINLINYRIWN